MWGQPPRLSNRAKLRQLIDAGQLALLTSSLIKSITDLWPMPRIETD